MTEFNENMINDDELSEVSGGEGESNLTIKFKKGDRVKFRSEVNGEEMIHGSVWSSSKAFNTILVAIQVDVPYKGSNMARINQEKVFHE